MWSIRTLSFGGLLARLVLALGAALLFAFSVLSASESFAGVSSAAPRSSALGAPAPTFPLGALGVPGVQALDGGQQALDAARAARMSPEAVFARQRSLTAYEQLGATSAAQVAQRIFPNVMDRPAGGPPSLSSAGGRISRYVSPNAAELTLPGGKHGVIESFGPIAKQTSSAGFTPLNLALTDKGSAYTPTVSAVGVRIPKDLRAGVALSDLGVSVTPVDASGSPLTGSLGAIDGASVVYANTQTDADTVAKPTATGFELFDLLRSQRSPSRLGFRVGMPAGSHLIYHASSGTAQIVSSGRTLASVPRPDAVDAAGTPVPVTMSIGGDLLSVTVDLRSGEYQYPIAVDPTVIDKTLTKGHWEFLTNAGFSHNEASETLTDSAPKHESGQYALWGYETYGKSHIYSFESETAESGSPMENELVIVPPSKVEETFWGYYPGYARTKVRICTDEPKQGECLTGKVETTNQSNVAYFKQVGVGSSSESFTATMYSAAVSILQEEGPTAKFNTSSPTISWGGEAYTNVLYAGAWLGPHSGIFEAETSDPGIGINQWSAKSPASSEWGLTVPFGCVECSTKSQILSFLYGKDCEGTSTCYNREHPLPDGEDTVEVKATNATGASGATSLLKVKVDATPPYGIALTGLPPNKEIGNGYYHLKATAKDGSGSTPSSGVKSMILMVDGTQVGNASGSCSPGPCTATGEWTISGSEFAVGQHEVTVTATDNAANEATEKFTMFVARPTSPIGVGPGSVDPQTGELRLNASDASVGAGVSSLGVGRGYGSLHLTAGAEGPLGPQWSLSVGSTQNLTKLPDGDMLLTNGLGLQAVFASKGGGSFTAPKGDAALTLSEQTVEGKAQYQLKDGSGNVTTFTLPSGGGGTTWFASRREHANSLHATTISYETVGSLIVPLQILAPKPAGVVSCSPELVKGCRALGFVYSSKTTATGDGQTEWGEYENRLKEITFTAWSSSAGKMTTTAVTKYEYDKEGKLRAEWDPRISPALKTTYGYDSEGHLTAMTSPGQQPWLFTYGSILGDQRNGRLIAVTRPSASTEAGTGVAPSNTAAPTVSGSTTVGSKLTVTTGTWTNSPLSYTYQWESCNFSGEECAPIAGATNPGYVISQNQASKKFRARVWATDADGTGVAVSAVTALVEAPKWYYYEFGSLGSGNGEFNTPTGAVVDGKHNLWVVDSANNRIEKFSESGRFTAAYGSSGSGNGQFSKPTGIAVNTSTEDIYVVDTGNNRIEKFESNGKYVSQFGKSGGGNGEFKEPLGIAVGKNYIYVVDSGNSRVQEFSVSTEKFSYAWGTAGSGNGQFSKPQGIALYATGPATYAYVTDTGNNRVEKFSVPLGVYESKFGESGSGNGKFSAPTGIVSNPNTGEMHIVDKGNNRVETWYSNGSYGGQFGTSGSGYYGQFSSPQWIAELHEGDYFVTDTGNNRVEQVSNTLLPEPPVEPATPPNPGTSAVTTVEYKVPITGKTAPYPMGDKETATWGQSVDTPAEATGVFPPDEVEGWPAQDYRRATIYYVDGSGRTTNVASPGGGISTTEYGLYNNIGRTLSADDRAAALKEGSKSAEVAEKLYTQHFYKEEGAELESTLGPEHKIKLANGTEAEARRRQRYYYDEGAPSEGGPYRLVTKVTDAAEVAGKEEETRTSTDGYSGQENLGWKLHAPTAITTDPSGLKLMHTAVYDATTANLLESTLPTGVAENPPPAFALQFGSKGSGNGQFFSTTGVAVDASGNVWAVDIGDNRVEKFTGSGTFSASYGSTGTGELQFSKPYGIAINKSTGNVYICDGGNNRIEELSSTGTFVRTFGSFGTGNGQFNTPYGIAIDGSGNVWVTDLGNNRIEKFSSEGAFSAAYGAYGSEHGQMIKPYGIAATESDIYVADSGNSRIEEFNLKGEYAGVFGSSGTGEGQFTTPKGIAADPKSGALYVVDSGNSRVERFSAAGAYQTQFGVKGTGAGQMSSPEFAAVNSSGAVYVGDTEDDRVEKWVPNGGGAHTTQTIYYSAEANSTYPNCGGHAEWAELACQTQPAKQPETAGLPALPVTTYTYNLWQEPETVVDTVGSTTRTITYTYDSAGRIVSRAITSTVGTALPTVKYEYDSKLGALTVESTTTEGVTKKLTQSYNKLMQLTSYTDADENTATYTYDVDGRLEKFADGKGSQTFAYDTTTGLETKLVDSAAGTFTATYDVEGNMVSEGMPNGMSVNYTYDPAGSVTNQEDVKTTHCSSKCTWFSDSVVPSIYGQWLSQVSTLSSQGYTYDNAGRLVQVQDTPVGKGCVTRLYTYDADTNRTMLTTREPGAEGKCATEGGTAETHLYDTADRLVDGGTTYNTFGDTTALSAGNAGGYELTSAFYVDNRLQSQTQNGETIGYNLDPLFRPRETVSTGKTTATVTSHFDGSGSDPAWTSEASGKWTRNIPGIDGNLAAIQYNGETPVLQIGNLHGDIVGTASLSETATELSSTADTTEYGVPRGSAPPKYSWLGAHELPTEMPSGVIGMGARTYVPQLGRFLQPDPVSGGSADAYAYTFGDPVNTSDLSGEFAAWFVQFSSENANEVAEQAAARELAAQIEAERKAREAAEEAGSSMTPAEGEEEYEEEEYEEEEYEEGYAAYHSEEKQDRGQEAEKAEKAVLSQPIGYEGIFDEPLNNGDEQSEDTSLQTKELSLCVRGREAPCTRYAHSRKKKKGKRRAKKKAPQPSKNPEAKPCNVYKDGHPSCGEPEDCKIICGNTPEEEAVREVAKLLEQPAEETLENAAEKKLEPPDASGGE